MEADLPADGAVGVVHSDPHPSLLERLCHPRSVLLVLLRDGDDLHLHRREPGREVASPVLGQEGYEPLVGRERGAVDDEDLAVLRTGLVLVGQREPLLGGEVELNGGHRLLPAQQRGELDVDLGPVEGGLADGLDIGHPQTVQYLPEVVLGGRPVLGLVDVLVRGLGVPEGELEVVVLESEGGVVVLHHADVVSELLSDLVEGAVDVRVVHRQHPDPEQPCQSA